MIKYNTDLLLLSEYSTVNGRESLLPTWYRILRLCPEDPNALLQERRL